MKTRQQKYRTETLPARKQKHITVVIKDKDELFFRYIAKASRDGRL